MGTLASENGASRPAAVFPLDDHEAVRRGVSDTLEAGGDVKGAAQHAREGGAG
jgi:hypothetical protein